MFFVLGLILSGALCNASSVARIEMKNEKGEGSILTILKAQHGGIDKSSSIIASIDGNVLTVEFNENLGRVYVEVSLIDGGETQVESTPTPNGVLLYLPNAGNYRLTLIFSDGDEYYCEFEVMN